MNVDTLIDRLITLREHALPGTALVKAYDGDSGKLEEATGFLFDQALCASPALQGWGQAKHLR